MTIKEVNVANRHRAPPKTAQLMVPAVLHAPAPTRKHHPVALLLSMRANAEALVGKLV